MDQSTVRGKKIVRTSVIGIGANLLLAAFKAIVGLAANSIAIVLDAVNNLSDAASSAITIIGTKLAGKQPDRKHPFGYGRVEYLSAMVISVIVLYAGISSFIESVKKIIRPETPDYSTITLIIVAVAVAVKIVLGIYVRKVGKDVKSDSLVNSGTDAMLDSVISATTLVAAAVFILFHVSLEAWLGAVISLVIIKSGVDMLRETLSEILGERADAELAKGIKKTIRSFPEVLGVYDLVLHNYGPDQYQGSVHIEVTDTITVDRLDELNRMIAYKVFEEHNVIMTAIGVYSMNTHSEKAIEMKNRIGKVVFSHDNVLQMHGFYLNEQAKTIRFDLLISFDEKDRTALYQHIVDDVKELYPDYTLLVVMDTDFCES